MTHPDTPRPPMSETVTDEVWAVISRIAAQHFMRRSDDRTTRCDACGNTGSLIGFYHKPSCWLERASVNPYATIADLEVKLAEWKMHAHDAYNQRDAVNTKAEKAERDLAQSREMNECPNYCSACGDSFASFVQHGCVGFDKHELEKPCPLEALPTTGSAP